MTSIFAGRGHAKTMLPFKDISLLPLGFTSAVEAIKCCYDIIQELRKTYPMLASTTSNGNFDILKYTPVTTIKTIDQMLEVLTQIIKNQNMDGKVMLCVHADAGQYSK